MLRVVLACARAIGRGHDRWRAAIGRRKPLSAEIGVLHERAERLDAENRLLRTRLERIDPRRRPHYRSAERLAILWHAARYGLSVEATAKAFVVSVHGVFDWRRDVAADTGRLVRGEAPVNRLPEAVGELARRIKAEWPGWGTRRIAGVLARLGLSASRSSVQSMLRKPPPEPTPCAPLAVRPRGALVAKRPRHLWFLDFTRVGGLFRSVVVGAVIDGYSRKVLSLRVAPQEPSSFFAVQLVRDAVREFGPPTWMVTDRGTQLTAKQFCCELRRTRIGHRYGAVHRHGSISVVERWWKSLKIEYRPDLVIYRPLKSIEAKIRGYARWFNEERPHQGLAQRTPDEVFFARTDRPQSVPIRSSLTVEHLDGDAALPVLRLRRAA